MSLDLPQLLPLPDRDVMADLHQRTSDYLRRWGEPTLRTALDCGHLFYGMRGMSLLALAQGAQAYEELVPAGLVISTNPLVKQLGKRAEARLALGPNGVMLQFGMRNLAS